MSKPSVGTLYAIVTELGISLDSVIRGDTVTGEPQITPTGSLNGATTSVVRHGMAQSIELASGVRWEELTASTEDAIDFLHAIYEVGGASTPDQSMMRHHGREYGYITQGTLGIQIGFTEYELEAGDSIAFDSTTPHRLFNKGDVPVHAVWFVIGRESDGQLHE
jgi:mannose-6-phosphate isomerase-like protein (cupin superfamily)